MNAHSHASDEGGEIVCRVSEEALDRLNTDDRNSNEQTDARLQRIFNNNLVIIHRKANEKYLLGEITNEDNQRVIQILEKDIE